MEWHNNMIAMCQLIQRHVFLFLLNKCNPPAPLEPSSGTVTESDIDKQIISKVKISRHAGLLILPK